MPPQERETEADKGNLERLRRDIIGIFDELSMRLESIERTLEREPVPPIVPPIPPPIPTIPVAPPEVMIEREDISKLRSDVLDAIRGLSNRLSRVEGMITRPPPVEMGVGVIEGLSKVLRKQSSDMEKSFRKILIETFGAPGVGKRRRVSEGDMNAREYWNPKTGVRFWGIEETDPYTGEKFVLDRDLMDKLENLFGFPREWYIVSEETQRKLAPDWDTWKALADELYMREELASPKHLSESQLRDAGLDDIDIENIRSYIRLQPEQYPTRTELLFSEAVLRRKKGLGELEEPWKGER